MTDNKKLRELEGLLKKLMEMENGESLILLQNAFPDVEEALYFTVGDAKKALAQKKQEGREEEREISLWLVDKLKEAMEIGGWDKSKEPPEYWINRAKREVKKLKAVQGGKRQDG